MRRALQAGAFALLAGLAAGGAGPRPLRVMSISDCGDQLVLALLPPSQITSVTWLARDPSLSVMAEAAVRVRANHGQAEEVLRDQPDLVVAGTYTTPAARALLKALRVPMLELGPANSFDDIRRQTRAVAAAVGARGRGEALIAGMDADLRRLGPESRTPVRVAAWDGAGFAAAPGSLYAALLQAAGARDVAAEPGRTARGNGAAVEGLLAARPDLLVEDEPGSERPGLRTAVLDHPAIRRLWSARTVFLPARDYLCGTPFSVRGALSLRQQIRARTAGARPLPPWRAAP